MAVCTLGMMAGTVWGQITGDRYAILEKSTYSIKNISSNRGNAANHDARLAVDGNSNSYWEAATRGTTYLDIEFNKTTTFEHIFLQQGEESWHRSTDIIIYTSNDGKKWNRVQTFSGFNRGDEEFIDLNLYLDEEINTKYIRFELKGDNDNATNKGIREITFNKASDLSYRNITIQHKPAKWHTIRNNASISSEDKAKDTFSDGEEMYRPETSNAFPNDVQATHTYIDTIYVHKGTTVQLILPTVSRNELPDGDAPSNASTQTYQRWYSFRTDGTFETAEDNKVRDLLTPINSEAYRFENGYIGYPLIDNTSNKTGLYRMNFYFPTDEEYKEFFPNAQGDLQNNRFYLVACDVSSYTDYTEEYTEASASSQFINENNTAIEPTLSHRAIFYIHAVEDETSWYHKALDNNDFLYEYTINFPAEHVGTTDELVSLPMDARAFVVPGGGDNDSETALDVSRVGENSAGITLNSTTISGMERIIQFKYPNNNTRTNGNSATIEVTKDGKKLVKYNLTFSEESKPLRQSEVAALSQNSELYHRKPEYLEQNYTLLTALNFDYGDDVASVYGQNTYYPFPVNWDYSSYAFYDGSVDERYPHDPASKGIGDYVGAQGNNAEWGNYAITKDYIEGNPPEPISGTEETGYHLYVDASDRPGVIMRAPFREALCPGSELFVSAWIKSAAKRDDSAKGDRADACVLFTILGVTENEDGTETYTPLYRHCSGQVRLTTELGYENEWYQVYFPFSISSELDYDSYYLQLDNNSASTHGGDIYLDDIRVYIATPEAEVEQQTPTCADETLLSLRISWERLLSRINENEVTGNENGVTRYLNFCFIDAQKYEDHLAGDENPSEYKLIEALQYARAQFAYPTDGGGQTQPFELGKLSFSTNFSKNETYKENGTNTQAPNTGDDDAPDSHMFAYQIDRRNRVLAVDIYADLEPLRTYYLALEAINASGTPQWVHFIDLLDRCSITSTFQVESQTIIKINGDILEPGVTDFCAGQVVNFSVQLQADLDGDSKLEPIEQAGYCDWFLGTQTEFETETNGISLKYALAQFRTVFPDADEIQAAPTNSNYTSEMEALLRSYAEPQSGEPRLILHQISISVPLEEGTFQMMACPIEKDIWVEEENVRGLICWEPMPIILNVSGEAPTAYIGFHGERYPGADDLGFRSAVRLGLTQMSRSESAPIKVPLRDIEFTSNSDVESLDSDTENPYLYLTASDDPDALAIINSTDFRATDWPVATVTDFEATRTGNDNHITFYFNNSIPNSPTFTAREGYTYTLETRFVEKNNMGGVIENHCYGNLVFDIKIVPEYQKWVGDAGGVGNWNKDSNWKRSDKDELNNPSGYTTNTVNETDNGFVPMRFTKVTIPRDGEVQLYKPGTKSSRILNLTEVTEGILPTGDIEDYIEYDLMVKSATGSGYDCEPYYTNTVSEIHFEPNTEMLHTELLTYDKAWVDYELAKGRWYTLASPLQGVVAGDFYTDKNGREGQAYFSDINYDPNNNDRFNPSVYQRGWKGSATLQTLNSGPKEVAIEGNWSSVYNDVTVPYSEGTGFSLKVQDITDGTSALFRLPKADPSYTYYNSDGSTASPAVTEQITRTGVHKLYTDKVEVALEEAQDGTHYLVGNPYMAHINATKFFEQNVGLLQKYWLVDNNGQKVAEGSEISTTGDATIAPLQSFFVAIDETAATKPDKVTFTKEMQTLGSDENDNLRSTDILYLTATTSDGKQSRAALAYNLAANNDYEANEDAELFLDSNLSDVPTVYTVAGTMATSINQTSELYNIPVGVYSAGATSENVSLTFSGLDGFSYATLYDAETGTDTPLHEGSSFSVPANTNGRYFLRAGVPTANEAVQENAIRIYSVGGQLVVTSTAPLQQVYIYDFAGRLVDSETRLHTTRYTTDLPAGNYMVKARSVSGEKIEKFKLRN